MKDITLNNGSVMTDAEFVQQRGMGDTLTDFVATKDDLVLLANKLVDKLLFDEFILLLQTSRSDINRREYSSFRLERVMEFLPELEADIQERLRVGRHKNEIKAMQAVETAEQANAA
jgi:translation elongation factor EF-Ts